MAMCVLCDMKEVSIYIECRDFNMLIVMCNKWPWLFITYDIWHSYYTHLKQGENSISSDCWAIKLNTLLVLCYKHSLPKVKTAYDIWLVNCLWTVMNACDLTFCILRVMSVLLHSALPILTLLSILSVKILVNKHSVHLLFCVINSHVMLWQHKTS